MWRTQLLTVWPRCPKRLFDGGDSSIHDFHLIISPNKYDAGRAKQEGVPRNRSNI